VIEPFRARPFPVLKDLIVDRAAFDKIIQAGEYISVNTGGIPDANAKPIPRANAELSMDATACISGGACVAACKNASAIFYVSANRSLNDCQRGSQKRRSAVRLRWPKLTGWDSETEQTPAPAKTNVQKRFPSATSPG